MGEMGENDMLSNMEEKIAEAVVKNTFETYKDANEATASEPSPTLLGTIINEILYSPMNLGLLAIIIYLIYKIVRDRSEVPKPSSGQSVENALPKLRRDFTVMELRKFDGKQPGGRVLVGVNGSVYDVTNGKRFYGPGGPYAMFAGRDASRNLATFSVDLNEKEEYDDLSDLTAVEMESVSEWELQFKEKYDYVGKLLRTGEEPTNYEDDDEETATDDKQNAEFVEPDADVAEGLRKRDVQSENVESNAAADDDN